MPFHTCGPNEAMVISGEFRFHFSVGTGYVDHHLHIDPAYPLGGGLQLVILL